MAAPWWPWRTKSLGALRAEPRDHPRCAQWRRLAAHRPKAVVHHGDQAQMLLVSAHLGRGGRENGISLFLVPADATQA